MSSNADYGDRLSDLAKAVDQAADRSRQAHINHALEQVNYLSEDIAVLLADHHACVVRVDDDGEVTVTPNGSSATDAAST